MKEVVMEDYETALSVLVKSDTPEFVAVGVLFGLVFDHIERTEELLGQGQEVIEGLAESPMIGGMLKMFG